MPEQAQNNAEVGNTEQTVNINGIVYKRWPELVKGSCAGCCARNKTDLCEELSSNNASGSCYGVVFTEVMKKPIDKATVAVSCNNVGTTTPVPNDSKEVIFGRKDDSGKLRYSLIPPYALEQVAKCLTTGASKYAPDNWKYVDKAKERYLDALIRHTEAYRKGETVDAEGNDHLAAIAVNALFLLEFRYSPEFNKGVSE